MNKIISRPKRWGTHMPMLIKLVQMTNGPVLELGAGLFSTPLLHWLCRERKVKLVTYEDNPEYYKFAVDFRSRGHSVRLIKDWNEIDTKTHWGVVLIDHGLLPEQRAIDTIKLKDKADYLVLHDSQYESLYSEVWKHFKYRYDWKDCKPWTTVVSNLKDLSDLNV